MAEKPITYTKRSLTRKKLAMFLPDDPELIRYFENLSQDVSVVIPDAIAASSSDVDSVLLQASFTRTQQVPQFVENDQSILSAAVFGG